MKQPRDSKGRFVKVAKQSRDSRGRFMSNKVTCKGGVCSTPEKTIDGSGNVLYDNPDGLNVIFTDRGVPGVENDLIAAYKEFKAGKHKRECTVRQTQRIMLTGFGAPVAAEGATMKVTPDRNGKVRVTVSFLIDAP